MLSAYFDDSGTHSSSPIVVYGGLIGLDSTWDRVKAQWAEALQAHQIPYFHLAELNARKRIYKDWSRAKIDLVIGDFRRIIIRHDLWCISACVVRADWDALVIGETRKSLGEADEFCALMCIHDAMRFNTANKAQKYLSVAFDKRTNRSSAISTRVTHMLNSPLYGVAVNGLSFVDMKTVLPMQAADMVATETYWNAQEWLAAGGQPAFPSRPHFQRFIENGKMIGGIAGRSAIEKIIIIDRLGSLWTQGLSTV